MYQNKSYINKKTIQEIDEKGFSVYNYISFKELISTVNKDYLQTLNLINIPFAIVTGIVGYMSYESNSIIFLILLFLGVYFLVFTYLIIKLIYRTYKFSLITNVIYTKQGIVINDNVHHYKDDLKLKLLLEKLENLFEEYLSKPSNLKSIIKNEREKLLKKLSSNFKSVSKLSGNTRRVNKDTGKFIFIAYAILVVYSISVVFFYFIGMIIGFIFFLILISLISLYFSINKSDELKIKQEVTKIDKELLDLENIYLNLNEKMTTFNQGEIFDLSKHIEDEYNDFYQKINKIIDHKDKLKDIIKNSSYKDFIDFPLFVIYIRDQFNKPLNEMIKLLVNYQEKVSTELTQAKQALQNTDSKEKYQIEARIVNLETIYKNINKHLEQLRISVL
jgi:ABC-type multidrug transport system fused ATPase/permease subunit